METSGEQTLAFFNVFLAPFAKGLKTERVREGLRFFISNLNQFLSEKGLPIEASLGIELVVPEFLEKENAIGPDGKQIGCYADFSEETRLISSLLFEVMFEDDRHKPLFNPGVIIGLRPETLRSKECEDLLFLSHKLAAQTGLPYFANLCFREQKQALYTATGCRFAADWKGDWELDTLRTGSLDSVIINLPRVSYASGEDRTKFFRLLDEQLEMALRALEIKYRTVKRRAKEDLLPFLAQETDGDRYFRLENFLRCVGFVGLNEAVQSLCGNALHAGQEALDLAEEIVTSLFSGVKRGAKKPETRAVLSMVSTADAAKRLAELDVEKYGWAKAKVQGTKELPFYTDMVAAPLNADIPWKKRLRIEQKFHRLTPGSHLALIQLADLELDPDKLLSVTREITGAYRVGLYAYNRNLAYCTRCQKAFYGVASKCPLCGSVNMLVCFSRVPARHLASSRWMPTQRIALGERAPYMLISG